MIDNDETDPEGLGPDDLPELPPGHEPAALGPAADRDEIDEDLGGPSEPEIPRPAGAPTSPPLRILRRDPNGPLAGVATGLARYFNVEPVIVQVLFVLATFAAASGLILYVALWLLIPAADSDKRTGIVAVVVGVALVIGGVSAGFSVVNFGFGDSFLLWVILIGVGVYLLNQRSEEVAGLGGVLNEMVTATPAAAPPPSAYAGTPQASPAPPVAGWAVPRTDQSYRAPEPPEPRPAGPPITLITVAIGGMAAGAMVLLSQVAGLSIGPGLVVGVLLTICGLGLIVSAFVGRAPGLIPIAILLGLGVLVASVDNVSGIHIGSGIGQRTYTISDPSLIEPVYEMGVGEMIIDLTNLELEKDELLDLKMGAGSIQVVVPTDMRIDVELETRVGSLALFDRSKEGENVNLVEEYRPAGISAEGPTLTIEADVRLGEVVITHGN